MLGKLLKYEYKATVITFIPILLAFIVSAAFIRLLGMISTDNIAISILNGLIIFAFIMLFIVILFFPIISGAQRFRKNLLKDEGYLMNTLPVKSGSLILTKFIASLSWVVASFVGAALALLILIIGNEKFSSVVDELKPVIEMAKNEISKRPLLVAEVIALIVLGFIVFLFQLYTAICIGHLSNSKRGLVSVGAFIGLYFVTEMISMTFASIFKDFYSTLTTEQALYYTFGPSIIFDLLYLVAFYFITSKILTKHLNLE